VSEGFDGTAFNQGIIFVGFIVLFLFGTLATGNDEFTPESEPQQTLTNLVENS